MKMIIAIQLQVKSKDYDESLDLRFRAIITDVFN